MHWASTCLVRARSWPFGFQSSIWKPSHRSRLFISFSLAIGFHEFYLVSCRIFLMHSKVVLLINSGKSFALLLVSFGGFPSSFFLFFECLGFPWSMLEFAIRIFARFLVLILCISLRGRWLFQDTIMFWTLAQSCPPHLWQWREWCIVISSDRTRFSCALHDRASYVSLCFLYWLHSSLLQVMPRKHTSVEPSKRPRVEASTPDTDYTPKFHTLTHQERYTPLSRHRFGESWEIDWDVLR